MTYKDICWSYHIPVEISLAKCMANFLPNDPVLEHFIQVLNTRLMVFNELFGHSLDRCLGNEYVYPTYFGMNMRRIGIFDGILDMNFHVHWASNKIDDFTKWCIKFRCLGSQCRRMASLEYLNIVGLDFHVICEYREKNDPKRCYINIEVSEDIVDTLSANLGEESLSVHETTLMSLFSLGLVMLRPWREKPPKVHTCCQGDHGQVCHTCLYINRMGWYKFHLMAMFDT